MKYLPRLGFAVLLFVLPSCFAFADCEVWITTISHRDNVSPSVNISSSTNCSSGDTFALYIDSTNMKQVTTGSGVTSMTYAATLSTTTNNPHSIYAKVTSGSTTASQSQAIKVQAVDPSTLGSGYTAVANMWNPSGCPSTNQSCSYGEKLPSGTAYADGRIYSNSANITKVSLYVDGVLKDYKDSLGGVQSYDYHNTTGFSLTSSGSPHRVTLQALAGSTVVGQAITYVNVVDLPTPGSFDSFNSNGGTFSNVDDVNTSYWDHTCNAGSGCEGTVAPADSTTVQEDGSSLKFSNNGENTSYAQAFWYFLWNDYFGSSAGLPNGNSPLKYVHLEFDGYIDNTSPVQALEFQVEQRISSSGYVRNFAFQDPYREAGYWRTYDFIEQHLAPIESWQPSGIPYIAPTQGCWYHFAFDFHTDENPSYTIPAYRSDAMWVYPVAGQTGCSSPYGTGRQPVLWHNAHDYGSGTGSNEWTNAVQLDTVGTFTQYHLYTEKMVVEATQ